MTDTEAELLAQVVNDKTESALFRADALCRLDMAKRIEWPEMPPQAFEAMGQFMVMYELGYQPQALAERLMAVMDLYAPGA